MRYQYQFYNQTPAPDQMLGFALISFSHSPTIDALYEKFKISTDPEAAQKLVFEYHLLDNYEERDQKLKKFIKEAKAKIKIQPILVDGMEFSFPFDYVRDGNGKIAPDVLFARWDRILKVYSLKKKGFNFTQISQELGKFNDADIPNSIKPIKRDLASAKTLIDSAGKGTFPYPPEKVDLLTLPPAP